jgi:predicted nicotinamide N-methyase
VSDASWSFFGLVWASGRQLAEAMSTGDLHDRRILEVGCGLALAGIVGQRRKADITASDRHPLAGSFLAANLLLNDLPPMPYVDVDWCAPPASLGRFDLLIASDVLYEPAHPGELARFVENHLSPGGEVLVVDPGRHLAGRFGRALAELGLPCVDDRPAGARMRVRRYRA